MPTLMLVNPRKRRKTAKKSSARRTRRTTARRSRRTNPIGVSAVKRTMRRRARRSGIVGRSTRRVIRRRRNPISLGRLSSGGLMNLLKGAAIGGAGAVGVEFIMGKLRQYLPTSLQPSGDGKPGLYDAVVAGVTVILGRGLSKTTKGLSEKAAIGALTVQAANLIRPQVAAMVPGMAGLGYAVPSPVVGYSSRISPIGRNMQAYAPAGSPTPLLNGAGGMRAYTRSNSLLSGMSGARRREGAVR